jgi:FKBP-type peptidyl-prolyl cis-trans isomerase
VLAVLALAGCQQGKTTEATPPSPAPAETSQAPQAQATSPEKEVVTPSGLHYQDLVVGDGILAEDGMQVLVNYTGWLTDGTKFDSSYDRGKPFEFTLGSGMVIRGWDEGVKGMRVGGKRKLTIPYDLAYGEEGRPGAIPPRATLVFEVELVNARKPQ